MRVIERCLQVSIALMALLATWMMSLGGDIPMMAPLMLFVAGCSLVFTDILGWFSLHRYLVNSVAIVAMLLTLTDFLEHDSTGQLLSIAYLLISWEAVMLFQRKTARVYWCIAVLSLLQVVVASVLNLDLQLGILLMAYLGLGFFAMVFFFLARELHRVEERRRGLGSAPGPIIAVDEASQQAVAGQLPLRRMFRSVAGLGAVSAVFAVVFFYGSPRIGGDWSQRRTTMAQTGFTSQVTLKEMGRILQSDAPVMRASFAKAGADRPYPVYSNLYFHGAVLTDYADGGWKLPRGSSGALPPAPLAPAPNQELVRVSVTLEPASDATLFTLLPAFRLDGRPRLNARYNENRCRLHRHNFVQQAVRHRYQFVTSVLRRGLQSQLRPHSVRRQPFDQGLRRGHRRLLLDIDRSKFPGLITLADRLTAKAGSKFQRTQALTNHFLTSDQYTYTLNFDEVASMRNYAVDPIEDFVTNHRHGHCEYFASALALMLRSQGVPSRLAVGYHGGEPNQLSGDVRVVESDAHAWVEAYFEPDEIPRALQTSMHNYAGGGWLRLDPTPAGDATTPRRSQLDEVLDYAHVLWTDYVLEMNPQRQRQTLEQAIGVPPTERVSGAASGIQVMTRQAAVTLRNSVEGEWFSWRAGVLTSGLLLAAIAAGRILFPIVRWLWTLLWKKPPRRPAAEPVEFYVQLEKLLRQGGLERGPSETQQEFAAAAGSALRQRGLEEVAGVPELVVRAFYRVRFGATPLPPGRRQAIDEALDRLSRRLDRSQQEAADRP